MKFCDFLNLGLCWLALNVYHEARGEPFAAQVDVAHVTLNRVESRRFPNSIEEVVKQYQQFSWYWDGKPDTPYNKKAWKEAVNAAVLALNSADTTDGALHYYNPFTSNPWWALAYPFVKVSGNHIFLE